MRSILIKAESQDHNVLKKDFFHVFESQLMIDLLQPGCNQKNNKDLEP